MNLVETNARLLSALHACTGCKSGLEFKEEFGRFITICLLGVLADLEQILLEAQHRWLRPTEICEILRNYQKFLITPDPPVTPPAGSLFLFDRKALRYFRKDGHRWRKKKDGKTVKEAHEKLKAGSVDVLHCYYAHGEDNENFQRRSYWMLDEQLEHIVLVHYREIKEGYKTSTSVPRLPNAVPASQIGTIQGSSAPCLSQGNAPTVTGQISYASSPNTADWSGQTLSSEFEDGDSGDDPGTSSLAQPILGSVFYNASLPTHEASGFAGLSRNQLGSGLAGVHFSHGASTSVQDEIHGSSSSVHDQKFGFEQPNGADFITNKLTDARLDSDRTVQNFAARGDGLSPALDIKGLTAASQRAVQGPLEHNFHLVHPQFQNCSSSHVADTSTAHIENKSKEDGANNDASGELKKLDSFGRWMDKEIGGTNDDKEVSSLSRHMQLDIDSLAPSLSQEQLFTINDFSPDWAYSEDETKVLIIGTFLGGMEHSTNTKWCCMFGEIEVSAEVLTSNVIRCHAPLHAPGRVPFYVTCSNRLACSEVREFEYREKPSRVAFSMAVRRQAFEWLVCKVHEGVRGPHVLDGKGQGVIHLAAALGYEWAMGPIIVAGVSPNFRDARGRTGLHWASYFGREETVIALVKLGTSPDAVEDPTPAFPGGQTAADLASSRGHKGIAGYLAEAHLSSHLCSLSPSENVMDSVSANIAAEKAAQTAVQNVDGVIEEQLSLKGSLAALRKSAHAAALIQAALRARSFRDRRLTRSNDDISEASLDLVALGSLNKVSKMGHFKDYLHSAAVKIQQKYRGWKGREDFLKIRSRIVKIQAHVRGHQVRKQYKKVVWSVGIVEKAILRWRRKGSGLRGFRLEKPIGNAVPEVGKTDEYDYLRVGRRQKFAGVEKALARVQSMVRHPEARDQYMRLVSKFDNLQIGDEGSSALQQAEKSEKLIKEEDLGSFIAD
ncbi:Calmodulin-binding transcription activator 2 [Vitis vinifera]|uniref:Calmodulin-binding transcription activator 2 n=1 Tax=Vitis vinifera TaxID=29760 RepID=A0A438F7F9_VITVI|nr:Calmodulin-binding transcription activator 2 [Vitis vinifera]